MAALFPSGPWVGFYNYLQGGERHLMDLGLSFRSGRITGDGADDINTFVIDGFYDVQKRECGWRKIYPSHSITYFGYREGKGIWGTWEIGKSKGGFQIWPLSEGGPPDLRKREVEKEQKEVVALPAGPTISCT